MAALPPDEADFSKKIRRNALENLKVFRIRRRNGRLAMMRATSHN
ncbi:hypothetical protein USDA257_c09760 [Sinorhizobium fredii USDA 257]|uniref:Uncharacterized protein n=1 Tax=Sinorhizobium fredii (strain USDA 257) TaxID=1185652 RepID=I3X112_SINF2|nr:hypothetical protein USDA257_c09760 [Sinorhizobium fredii USDA 257]